MQQFLGAWGFASGGGFSMDRLFLLFPLRFATVWVWALCPAQHTSWEFQDQCLSR